MQTDKQSAFQARFADLVNRFTSTQNEINIKKNQYLDLALKKKETLTTRRDSFLNPRNSGDSSLNDQEQSLLDDEEVKIRGEIDFND